MKLFSKSKKEKAPTSSSLRPDLYNINSHWFLGLLLLFILFAATLLVGLKFFYDEFGESYKNVQSDTNPESLINVSRLKSAIMKREALINSTSTVPRDPSM